MGFGDEYQSLSSMQDVTFPRTRFRDNLRVADSSGLGLHLMGDHLLGYAVKM